MVGLRPPGDPRVGPKGQKKFKKNKKIEKIENFETDLGWFGSDIGMVWGYFRTNFGPILKHRKFESSELKN